jgi:Zn-dependent protease
MLIAVAGPVSNLLQIPIWLCALWLFHMAAGSVFPSFKGAPDSIMQAGITMLATGVIINMLLAAFNMIPIPPLDGHYILEGLGPPAVTEFYNAVRPYSFLILMGVMWYTNWVDLAIGPFVRLAVRAVLFVLGAGS